MDAASDQCRSTTARALIALDAAASCERWLAGLLAMMMAPFIGSFLGVLIRRLPARRHVAIARSACEDCGRTLTAFELIPVVSFALQRGRCRGCGSTIAPMHLAVELVSLVIAAIVCVTAAGPSVLLFGCTLGWTLLALVWIDWERMPMPNALTLSLILGGFAATWWFDPVDLIWHAVAVPVGYGAKRAMSPGAGSLQGRDGQSHGGAMLLAGAGAWIGLLALSVVLLGVAAATLCEWTRLWLRVERPGWLAAPSMVPAVALAVWVVWLWQQATLHSLTPAVGIG